MKQKKNLDVRTDTEKLLSKIWAEIDGYNQTARVFENEADRIYKLYTNYNSLDTSSLDSTSKFPIVWNITQLIQPIVFSQMPEPYVERRFKDKDPQGRRASMILQRCLKAVLSLQDTIGTFKQAVYDYLLAGRAEVWCRYAPVFHKVPQIDEMTGQPSIGENGEPILIEELKYENVQIEYVPYKDFGYSNAKLWSGVKSAWRHFYLTREDAKKQLGESEAENLKYTYASTTDKKKQDESDATALHKKAKITEFWDVDTQMVYWISDADRKTIIKEAKDPLRLSRFLACPKPLFATKRTDNLIPTSDFTILKSLIDELDIVTTRESFMVDAMKAGGVSSPQAAAALEKVFDTDDNVIQPIKEWLTLKSQGGTQGGAIEWLPLDMFAKVLEQLRSRKEELKADIYEIDGISDVIRGATNPYESGKALEQKSQFASQRINERQRLVQEFIRDTLNIVAEIISEHFDPATIFEMAGVEMLGEEYIVNFESDVALLRNDVSRHFRIDVTLESLIQADEDKEKQSVNEFINAMAQIMGQSQTVLQVMPEFKPIVYEALRFAARRYKTGRDLEGLLDTAIDNEIAAQEAAKNEPPPQDPELMLKQFEAETSRMEEEQKGQLEQLRTQHKIQMDQMTLQHKTQLEVAQLQQAQAKLDLDKAHFQFERFKAQTKDQLDAAGVAAKQREIELKDKIASSQIALDAAALKLEREKNNFQNQLASFKLKAETEAARAEMLLHAKTESEKMAVQERTARQQTEQTTEKKVSEAQNSAKNSSDMAGVANAIAQAMKSIPAPVINVEAPKPTKRIGKIKKGKNGEATVEVTEEVEEDSDD